MTLNELNQENGIYLKELRESKNLSQKQLADILGVAQTTVSSWEKGKNGIPFEIAQKIQEKFHITINRDNSHSHNGYANSLSSNEFAFLEKLRCLDERSRINLLLNLVKYFENILLESNEKQQEILNLLNSTISCMTDMLLKSKEPGDEFSYSYKAFEKYAELLKDIAEEYKLTLE